MKRSPSPFSPQMRSLAEKVANGEVSLISIGPQCAAAGVIEALGLRTRAYPFDWLFSSLPMVEHCLKDDFATFLDPAQMQPVPIEARKTPSVNRAHHRFYREAFGVEHVFNHHDMPESLPHFQRAAHKFRKAKGRYLLHVVRGEPPELEREVRAVAAIVEGQVLAVCVTPGGGHQATLRDVAHGSNWSIHRMAAKSPLAAVGFGSTEDEAALGRFLLSRFGLPSPD